MATTTNGQATVTVTTAVTSTITTIIVGCVSGSSGKTGVGGNTASSASIIVTTPPPGTTITPVGGTYTATLSGNPFAGHQLYANTYYSSEIYSLAIPSLTGTLAVKASAVVQVSTFIWMYASSIEIFKTIATDNRTGALQLRYLYLIPIWEIFKR
jgi:cellulose 1,4-beta-cellobiosidase